MANTKGSDLTAMTGPLGTDIFIVVDDPGSIPATESLTLSLAWTGYFRPLADTRYLEIAKSGEIAALTAKATVVDGDFFLLEDSAASNAKKTVTGTQLWANFLKGKADALYFAITTAGQIAGLTEKTAPVGADKIRLDDSAAGDAVKYTTITNLLTGSGVAGELSVKFSTDTKTTPAATNDYFMMVDPDNGTPALKEHGVKIEDMWANALSAKAAADNPVKIPCIVATTANITLSGEQTIDGVLTSTNRVLVKDQTAGAENGIYVTAAGAWARSADFDVAAEVVDGTMVRVEQGTAAANTLWALTTNNPITVDTTSLAFAEIAGAGGGDVTKVGTPVDNEIGVWTGNGTIEGDTNLTWDGSEITVVGSSHVDHTAIITDDHAFEIDCDAAGFGDVKALDIFYTTGAISAGEDEAVILVNIDESASTGGAVVGLEILATAGSADVYGLEAGAVVNPIIQLSGVFGDMDSALVNATDRLTEFTSTGSDIVMFVADNDTVTIGDAAKFEEIEFLLDTIASGPGIQPTFEFSTGVGTWTAFTPTDGTNGMKNSGIIVWLDSDIPTWAVGTGSEFLIRITRTQNSLATSPIEDLVQIAAVTIYKWDKDGDFLIRNVKFKDATGVLDDSDNEQLIFQSTASAINHFEITNAASGNEPLLAAVGDDTDIDLKLAAKGTGNVDVTVGGVNIPTGEVFSINGTAITATTETLTNKSISADQITSLTPNRQTGTTYTLVIGDANKIIEMNNASANTLTIPLNSSVAFAVGDIINIIMYGAGITTVDGATSVTVNGVSSGGAAISAQYKGVSIHKTATDEWIMVGSHGTVA